ncbi:DUF481 domain-containing protein [Pseudoxanthomonas sp.]|uniref:DUF481 domain-containing protein n=1 Tax=Pseudoxanthomonas sp. TaxID=1871049 RepID=UPI0025901BBE|nr:DUF481 domain-containing protein [Pseudoxanthomonas sp.]MCR6685483.1 DUF481 domain-containing protein [Pseudoxanthomonas sp.]
MPVRHAAIPLLLAPLAPFAAQAQEADAATAGNWTGSGELGLALARGNSRSESLNTRLRFSREDERWKNAFSASALRSRAEVQGDFDDDGIEEERYETSANRYELSGSSAYKFDPRNHVSGSGRYENDDFAPYDYQATVALGYGHRFLDSERTKLVGEIGPGYRRARETETGEVQSSVIGRGLLDFRHQLTGNTELFNTLLVESGKDNTFAQNDLGVAVAMNAHFALKAGLQARHNSEVESADIKKTDTLTTVNLVYNFR